MGKGSATVSKPPKKGAPPIKALAPYLKAAAAVSVVAVAILVSKGLTKPINYLSTYNRDQMRDVFMGNDTWVVLCHNSTSAALSDKFTAAAKTLSGQALFGVLDCGGTLPSGKSVYRRFELSEASQPVIFVVAPGMKPQQAVPRHMQTHTGLVKWLKATIEPHASSVSSTKELEAKCMKREACAMILKSGQLNEHDKAQFKTAMYRHRNLRFVSIDSARHEVSIEKKLGMQLAEGQHKLVYFQSYNTTGKAKGAPRWGLRVYTGPMEGTAMGDFLDDAEAGRAKLTPVTRLPTVMARKKGLPPGGEAAGSKQGGAKAPEGETSQKEGGEAAASAEGAAGSRLDSDFAGSGMTKEQILEEFRKRQKRREAAKREQMDAEVEDFIVESDITDVDAEFAESGDSDSHTDSVEPDDAQEDVVDLDAL